VFDHLEESSQLVEVQPAHQSFPYQSNINNKLVLSRRVLQVQRAG
jgi:hypothetical protein